MEFSYKYQGSSNISDSVEYSEVSFAPDALRKPTFFVGALKQGLDFREAISALHQVVISDMRFQPKDRSEYFAWLAQMEQQMLATFVGNKSQAEERVEVISRELNDLNRQSHKLMRPFYKAQSKYFDYLYQHDKDAWWVLDPVITINPDEIFFECFSDDESSYGKLSCSFNVFENISDLECGTTNIDYSEGLYNQFQKIRNYKKTQLAVDPDGFKVKHQDDAEFEEKKIDLPDSWVRGFLQVSSAMTLPMVSFELQPMDIHNICSILRRNKERAGPRSIRYILSPDKPVRLRFEPWNIELICHRSIFRGNDAREVRIWGRRRIHILERLIPVSRKFTVHLMGDGMPSFYVAEMNDMSFTLGLSGWSANDWSRMGNFDLMAPRGDVSDEVALRVYQALQKDWVATSNQLARKVGIQESDARAALAKYSQQGQVLYDLNNDVYRIRELSREPLPMSVLRFSNERESKAQNFIDVGLVEVATPEFSNNTTQLSGKVLDNAVDYFPTLVVDKDYRLTTGECQCHFYHDNKLRKGPCEHMLAVRKQYNQSKEAKAGF